MPAPAFEPAPTTAAGPAAVPRLHVLTDTRGDRDPLPCVAGALRAAHALGVPIAVQVRHKSATDRELLELTRRVVAMVAEAGPPRCWVVVDDRVDVALAAAADGVHLGAHDLPVEVARRLGGDRLVIGGTAREPASARALTGAGAGYLGVGPCFATSTKDGLPAPLGVHLLGEVARQASVPVIAIGGVDVARAAALVRAGAHGVAVVSAVSEAADPQAATARLLEAVTVCR
ncbi:thiamine phosphate synthase [Pedococcus sp. NPDC057267]|uniref:thiamine phosphate synthase n=1 Tax=Pedococcus sp. NPDC057267 TaxID=3346077 RepID=UPI00363F5D41